MVKHKYNKIVIGVDQSYTATGLSIVADNIPLLITSLQFKGLKTRSEKRKHLADTLHKLLVKASKMASEVVINCERIRTQSPKGGKAKGDFGIRPGYLKMTGALVAVIVDVGFDYEVPVYSIDTRSWKSRIVGSSKARKDKDGKSETKMETVEFIQAKGFDLLKGHKKSGKNKGQPVYDDDAADAACIALYGFLPATDQKLQLEE